VTRRDVTIPLAAEPAEFWIRPSRTVAELRRRHGDIFRLSLNSGSSVLCVTGVEAHRAFLVEHVAKLSNEGGWNYVAQPMTKLGKGLVFMDGEEHRWFRQVLLPAFSPSAVAAHLPMIEEVVTRRLAAWPRDGEVQIYDEMNAITFEVTCQVLFGLGAGPQLSALHRIFRHMTLRRPSPPPSAAFTRRAVADALREIIRSRMEQPKKDVISQLVRAGRPDGTPLTEDDLLDHINTLVVAGHFTGAGFTSYMLLGLHGQSEYVARLREEFSAHDACTMETLAGMTELSRAVTEAERMTTPVPHLPRRVVEEFDFQGHRLAPGEIVLCSVAGTHFDPALFANPERGDPSRFAPPRSEQRQNPLALAGFATGPRRCIGALLAQVMIKIMVRGVLQGFDVTPLRDAYVPSLSMPIRRASNGMPFRVRAR
jgi:cytochrome P450